MSEARHLSIRISTDQNSFPAGSEIYVHVDVTNASSEAGVLPFWGLDNPVRAGYVFTVTRMSGQIPDSPVQMTKAYWLATGRRAPKANVTNPDQMLVSIGGGMGARTINSGETLHFSERLNDLFDVTRPGTYRVTVRRDREFDGWGKRADPDLPTESNSITLTVTDPPPPSIALQLTTVASSFAPGSAIDVAITVKNISGTQVSLPLDPSGPAAELNGYRFSVSRSMTSGALDDSVAKKRDYLLADQWVSDFYKYDQETIIQPEQTLVYQAELTHLFAMNKAGSYTVRAETVDPVTHLRVKSNAITIVVE